MSESDGRKQGKKKSKGFRRIVILSIIFSAWLLVSSMTQKNLSAQFLTGMNFQFILKDVGNFIANTLRPIILAIGSFSNSIHSSPTDIVYASSAISALGIIPLYDITKKGTESAGASGLISILYLFFAILIGSTWFSLVYLSLFPTLLLFGMSAYIHKFRVISFLFLLATVFVMPIATLVVLIFSLSVFYKDWENGEEAFTKHPYSVILEGISGFVFVDMVMRYSYRVLIEPNLLQSIDNTNLVTFHGGYLLSLVSQMFANLLPLLPEFTRSSNLWLSAVVMGVIVVIFVLVKLAAKKVQEHGVEM